MSRKLYRMLIMGVFLSILLSSGVLSCGSSTISSGDIMVTSSVSSGHTHKVTISGMDINNPPVGGKTLTTSDSSYHTHTITLAEQDYQTIQDGGTVTVTTSMVNNHTHTFTIKK